MNQNARIAKALGWEILEAPTYVPHPRGRGHMKVDSVNPSGHHSNIPDYTHDLNACAIMEERLGSMWREFEVYLDERLGPEAIFATAQQRCDAFCEVMLQRHPRSHLRRTSRLD